MKNKMSFINLRIKKVLTSAICALLIAVSMNPVMSIPVQAKTVQDNPPIYRICDVHSNDRKRLYRSLNRAAKERKKEVSISLEGPFYSEKQLEKMGIDVASQVRSMHPEYFLNNNIAFAYYNDYDGAKLTYKLGYLKLSNAQKEAMMKKADSIVAEARKVSSDPVEMLKYFRKKLCSEVKYDYKAARHSSSKYEQSYHAYGAFMNKKAVCQGYAYALKILCDKAGIPCWVITGRYGEPHAWNYVKLGSKYYQIDLTMDKASVPAEKSKVFLVGQNGIKGYRADSGSTPGKLSKYAYFRQPKK